MTPSISMILPTMGRPTLQRAVDSVYPQLGPNDELRIIGDDLFPQVSIDDYRVLCARDSSPLPSQYGNRQRNVGQIKARGELLCFLDDDDWYEPEALATIRRVAEDCLALHGELRPMFFRAVGWNGKPVWREPEVKRGNVGTCMLVLPRIAAKLPAWPVDPHPPGGISPRETDFDFIQSLVRLWGGASSIVWRPEVIYRCDRVKGYGLLQPQMGVSA